MKIQSTSIKLFLLFLFLSGQSPTTAQDDPFPPGLVPAAVPQPTIKPGVQDDEQDDVQDKPGIEPPTIKIPAKEYPPNYVRLYLNDGDIVSGELSTDSISISTEFGTLAVPVQRIVRFEPGLNSFPQIQQELSRLVEQLGSSKYEERQLAHKMLAAYGLKIRDELNRFDGGDNAERMRHLAEIKKEIDTMHEELDEDEQEDPENQPWERNDKLVTEKFTALGKIQQSSFSLKARFGDLVVPLQAIKKGQRPRGGRDAIERKLNVNKDNFVQFKSSGAEVEKGDTVSVTSTGNLTLTPWGSSVMSTANGMPQYGTMPNTPGIPYGALVARIGKNGKYFLVGSKKRFTASSSGKLYFGITMRASYVGKSYQFPGEYKVKVKVEPGMQ